jgi:hypothetical protein
MATASEREINHEVELDMTFITLLENCHTYGELQYELMKILSSGHLLLAKAKKNVRINSIDCREIIEAHCRVDYNEEEEAFTEWNTKPKVDPLLYIAALPPPDLKQAQKSFQKALQIAINLSSKTRNIVRDLTVLQSPSESSESTHERTESTPDESGVKGEVETKEEQGEGEGGEEKKDTEIS